MGVSEEACDSFVSLFGVLYRNPSNLSQFFLEDGSGVMALDVSQTV